MILLAILVLLAHVHTHETGFNCDARTVGLHPECEALHGPLVAGQDRTAGVPVPFLPRGWQP